MTHDEGWHRLHPLSPAVGTSRIVLALVVVFAPAFASGDDGGFYSSLSHLLVPVVLVGLAVVSWLVTRWRIEGSNLRIETGLLRRSSQRFPLSQVQAIDTVRPGLARLFGSSELRLRMGGTGGAARLAYLPSKQAEELRARLLALSRGAHEDTPEPQGDVLVTVPVARVVGSLAFSGPALVLLVYAVAFAVGDVLGPDATRAVTGSAAAILIADAVALWRRFNRAYGATVAAAPEGLRIRSGLVETTAETIPSGRVQAVQLVEPFLWRPFGWCRVDVDVAAVSTTPARSTGMSGSCVPRSLSAPGPKRSSCSRNSSLARPSPPAVRRGARAGSRRSAIAGSRSGSIIATRSRRPGGCRGSSPGCR